jgi:hypothetical protein
MSPKTFMDFVQNLELLLIFEVLVKKIPINYSQIHSKNSNFLLHV